MVKSNDDEIAFFSPQKKIIRGFFDCLQFCKVKHRLTSDPFPHIYVVDVTLNCTKNVILLHACVHRPVAIRLSSSSSSIGRMQAEATDSSLRGGIEALDVKDTEKSADVQEEDNSKQQDAEMTDATEEDSASKDEKSKSRKQK